MSEAKWSKWYIQTSGIRRYQIVAGKHVWERLPKAKYRHCKTKEELQKFVERINHRYEVDLEKAKAAYEFRHRFISQDHMDEFETLLKSEIPNKNVAVSAYTYLRRNCLHWFINQKGLPDPINWKEHEITWGLALLGKLEGKASQFNVFESKVHPDTISKHIQVMNRFLRFLHKKLPNDVPSITLEPISKANFSLYRAEYKQDGNRAGAYITDADWKVIEKEIDPTIKPFVQLGYYYGLRQSECLGVQLDDLFEDCLDVERQLVAFKDGKPKYGPVKNRLKRQVPHWFIEPKFTFEFIRDVPKLMHPDTFGDRFKEEMVRLKFKYRLHDLRRTFITRAFRASKNPRDIMLAAGHSDLDTTMRYAQDDRNLGRKKFVPKGAS